MLNTELRRVKRLRLNAPTDGSLVRGRILAEDALRTASLPGAQGGRVLVVRSLKLGVIRSGQSAASLALAIEDALYRLGPQAVYAEAAAAGASVVVYFKDEVEPYVRLAVRLARGQKADEWFWPLAVKCWRPSMATDEALRSLLGATLRTEAGTAAAVALVRELFEHGTLAPLLGALRWQDGPALLRACGWQQDANSPLAPIDARASEALSRTLTRWRSLLTNWSERWGVDDARTNWLAAAALAADKPARLQDQRLMSHARQLIKLASEDRERPRAAQPGLHDEQKNVEPATATPDAENEARRLNVPRPSEQPEAAPIARTNDARAEPKDERRLDETGDETLRREASRDAGAPPSIEAVRSNAPVLPEERETESRSSSSYEGWPRPTEYAGLFFLIPVLSRLGLPAMLETYPRLIECDVPERFLSLVAKRLGVAEDDAVLSFLDTHGRASLLSPSPASSRCEFVVPLKWRAGLCRRGPLVVCRRQDERGARLLCDSSRSLTLAVWRGRVPEGVRALVGDARLCRSMATARDELQVLLESLLVAARRWCRRYAGVGLRELVCRAGRVAETRTHIDVLFNHGQADVRVRKAGLDINPGWVAWLGRVVTFYYLYGEQGNGN